MIHFVFDYYFCIYSLKPVNVCKPAPTVEQKAPTTITHLLGQAKTATTSCLLILSPNLSLRRAVLVHDAKKRTIDKSNIERKNEQVNSMFEIKLNTLYKLLTLL